VCSTHPTLVAAQEASKSLTAKIDACMRIVGGAVPYSTEARKGRLGDFVAAMRHFQPFLWFNTVSDDPVGSLLALRSTFPSFSNTGFPAEVCGPADGNAAAAPFADNVRAFANQPYRMWPHPVRQVTGIAKTDYASLLTRATTNAAASAEGYRLDTSAMFRYMYGLPLNSETRATVSNDGAKTPGLFGRCTCGVSVTECNGRGWLHNHALASAGIPSWVFQAAAASGNPRILASLAAYVDACVSAELEPRLHVQSLLRRLFSFEPTRGPWLPVPPVPAFPDASAASLGPDGPPPAAAVERSRRSFAIFAQMCNERTNLHTKHSARCHCGKTGAAGCAACMPRPPTIEELTRPLRLPIARSSDLLQSDMPLRFDRRIFVTEPKRTVLGPFDEACSAPEDDDDTVERLFGATPAVEQAMFTEAAQLLRDAGGSIPDSDTAALLDALVALHDASRDGIAMSQAHVLTLVKSLPQKYRAALDRALAGRNLKVTEYNPVISAIRGCNTAIYLVSSGVAAQVSMLYTLKYITKDPVKRSATSSLALDARKHIAEYPSLAKDTGEVVRTAQHWLARILNSFNGKVRRVSGDGGGCARGHGAEHIRRPA